jgi:hypothetical protein
MLTVNIVFTIVMNYFNARNELRNNWDVWVYFVVIFCFDLIIILFTLLWIKQIKTSQRSDISIPYSPKPLDRMLKIVNIINLSIGLINVFTWLFWSGYQYGNKYFEFAISLQTFLVFTYWGWFMFFSRDRASYSYMKEIKIVSEWNFTFLPKYNTYFENRFVEWRKAYNHLLIKKNEKVGFWKRVWLIFTKFDWTNKKWRKNLVESSEFNFENLGKIFSLKDSTEYEDFCKFRFVVLATIFKDIYKDEKDTERKFKLFFWIREPEALVEFEKKIKEFKV